MEVQTVIVATTDARDGELEGRRGRWVWKGKLGEKREVVIGTAAQLEA